MFILTRSATNGDAISTLFWRGGGGFYRQTAPGLNFRMLYFFEIRNKFGVDAVLPSPSSENVADGVLSVSV
jgi:hypothetical protein